MIREGDTVIARMHDEEGMFLQATSTRYATYNNNSNKCMSGFAHYALCLASWLTVWIVVVA
jgi:hypothetical protein